MQRTVELTEAEAKVEKELITSTVTREQLIYYILETVHVGEDDLDSAVNALLC